MEEQMSISDEMIRAAAAVELGRNDAGAATVGDYLRKLLATLWREEEGFDGKRPFGNSSWQSDVEIPLIRAGLIPGQLDEDGYIDEVDDEASGALLLAVIERGLGQPPVSRDALEQLARQWETEAGVILTPGSGDDDPLGRPQQPGFAAGTAAGTLRECARSLRSLLSGDDAPAGASGDSRQVPASSQVRSLAVEDGSQ